MGNRWIQVKSHSNDGVAFHHPMSGSHVEMVRHGDKYAILHDKKVAGKDLELDEAKEVARKIMINHKAKTATVNMPNNSLAQNEISPIKKALPPKLAYRFRKWMLEHRYGNNKGTTIKPQAEIKPQLKREEMKKSATKVSIYKNNVVRLDFDAGTPEAVKEQAISWAKRKGLEIAESSLSKSTNSEQYVILSYKGILPKDLGSVKVITIV